MQDAVARVRASRPSARNDRVSCIQIGETNKAYLPEIVIVWLYNIFSLKSSKNYITLHCDLNYISNIVASKAKPHHGPGRTRAKRVSGQVLVC